MYSFLPEQTAGVGTRNLHVCELQGILWPIIGYKLATILKCIKKKNPVSR